MPAYVNSPFPPVQLLQKGVAAYLFGSYNYRQANTKIQVSQVALASNVATITGQIVEGEVPVVGAYISVTQTVTSSGVFNVTRALVTAASFNNNGFGTVSYAVTNANIGATADFGTAIVEVPEVAETLAAVASIPVALSMTEESQRTVTTSVLFPTVPTAATVVLQEAVRNVDGSAGRSEWTTISNSAGNTNAAVIASSAYTAGPLAQYTLTRGNYYRFLVSGITGSGTIVAKVL